MLLRITPFVKHFPILLKAWVLLNWWALGYQVDLGLRYWPQGHKVLDIWCRFGIV